MADGLSFAEAVGVAIFEGFACRLTFWDLFLSGSPGRCCLVLVGRLRMGGSMGGGSRLSSNCVSTSRELDRLRFWPLSPSGLSSLVPTPGFKGSFSVLLVDSVAM